MAEIQSAGAAIMTLDDDTFKELLRINDELIKLCQWLNERRDVATASRLIPFVDELTHLLAETGKDRGEC